MRSTGRELWQWTQIDITGADVWHRNGGIAGTLDEAKAALRGDGLDRRCTRPSRRASAFGFRQRTLGPHTGYARVVP